MTILYLDTSSSFLYTAIKKDDEIIAEIKEELDNNLSKFALSRIEGMFKIKNISYDEIDKIIVVNGPGSFTGIRIGLTIAKTLAWAKKISIVTISSLEAMALSADSSHNYIVPAIDARRNFLYASIYDNKNKSFIMNEKYISIDTLNVALGNLYGDVVFITNDKLDINYDIEPYDPKIDVLIDKFKDREAINPHSIDANYLKLTEAEEKKLKED